MSTVIKQQPEIETPQDDSIVPAEQWYDRSSLHGDYMVMIAGQTAEDFERYAPEGRICEYFDGIIYMPSPATDRHQEQTNFLTHLLISFGSTRGSGRILTGPAVLRLTSEWKPEPDIFVRPPADAAASQPPALLVVELLSKSTRQHDLGLKLAVYREVGIPDIWMIDDLHHVLHAYTKIGPRDQYEHQTLTEGRVSASAIPGFWIDVAWLWEDPLPSPLLCFDKILGGAPRHQPG